MTNKMKKILAIGFAAIAVAFFADRAYASDTQVWVTMGASAEVVPGVTLGVQEEFRLSDKADILRQHTDLNLTVGAVRDLATLTVGYRNTSLDEHRPYAGVNLSLMDGELSLDSVTRLELRVQDDKSIRGRTALVAGTTMAGLDLSLTEEVLVDQDGLNENRATVGVGYSVNKLLGVNAFYMLQTTGLSGDANNTHVLGVAAALNL